MKFHEIDQNKIPAGASFVVKAIHRMGSVLARRTTEELAGSMAFNLAEWRIASGLYTFGRSSQRTLIAYTGSEQAHASRVLAGLENRGLVQSAQSHEDKRARDFELSDQGKKAYEHTLPSMARFLDRIDDALSEEELKVFVSYLQRLLAATEGEAVRPSTNIDNSLD